MKSIRYAGSNCSLSQARDWPGLYRYKINYIRVVDVDIVDEVKNVIDMEIEGLKQLSNNVNNMDGDLRRVVHIIRNLDGHLIVSGIGKSGIIGRKISSTMASLGTPSFFLHPSEAAHGDLGMVTKKDAILFISNSGNTEELVCIMPFFKDMGIKTILISGNPDSILARSCDLFLDTGKLIEADPHDLAPTTSATAAMVLGDALAIAISRSTKFGPVQLAQLHPGGSLGKRLNERT